LIGVIADGKRGKDGAEYKTVFYFTRSDNDLSKVEVFGGN
jgi:hypothetical protein